MADFARSDRPAVQAQLDRLAALSPGGDTLGLDRITRLLAALGDPHHYLPPVFHVAGTNGKGSTCAFLRAGLEGAKRTVHMFTSPHLVRFNERIRLRGDLIEDDHLADLLEEVLDAAGDIAPSFFEVTTAAAFLAFARVKADACVVEVGLGGRLDATNVIERPLVTGIAALGHDHAQFLGTDLAGIAREKAGIAKPGVPLLCLDYGEELLTAINEVAEARGALLHPAYYGWAYDVVGERLQYRDRKGIANLPLPDLPGPHQVDNAALAIAMLRFQDSIDVPFEALRRATMNAWWPARMQRLGAGPLTDRLPAGSELWVDGGHNPSAAEAIAAHVRAAFDDDLPLLLLFASLSSKDPRGILEPMRGLAAEVRTLPIAGHAAHAPEDLAELAHSLGFEARAFDGLDAALAGIDAPARVLVFGSLYLAGEALALNGERPD